MRIFAVFFLCLSLYFVPTNATARERAKLTQKLGGASHTFHRIVTSPVKKTGFLATRILDEVDLFQQNTNHQIAALIWKDSIFISQAPTTITTLVQTFNFKADFSFNFIFNVLYPKHTFW